MKKKEKTPETGDLGISGRKKISDLDLGLDIGDGIKLHRLSAGVGMGKIAEKALDKMCTLSVAHHSSPHMGIGNKERNQFEKNEKHRKLGTWVFQREKKSQNWTWD